MSEKIEIAKLRLQNQCLSHPIAGKPEEVVQNLVAMQAQDYFGALWAVGMRLAKGRMKEVEDAFMEGRVLRTHVMRPTWHFVIPDDIRWLLKLTAPRVHKANASMVRQQKLDAKILSRTNRIIENALSEGNQLTRNEIGEALKQKGISASGLRLIYILMHAELEQIICSGARRGKQFTYALLDDRALVQNTIFDKEETLARFAERFFTNRGPATAADFAHWSGLTLAQARDGLDGVEADLSSTEINGQEYWFSETTRKRKNAYSDSFLLSNFDEYIGAYKDKSFILDHPGQIASLFDYAFSHYVIIDGHVAGSWRRVRSKEGVKVHIRAIEPLSASEKLLVRAAGERYQVFLGQPVQVEF